MIRFKHLAIAATGSALAVLVVREARHYHRDRCLLCPRRASHLDPDCDRALELCPWCRGGRGEDSQGPTAGDGIGLGTTASAPREISADPAHTTPDRSHLEPSILDADELADRAPFLDYLARVDAGLDHEAVAHA